MGNQILKDARGRVLGMIETKPSGIQYTRDAKRCCFLGVMITPQILQEMNVVARSDQETFWGRFSGKTQVNKSSIDSAFK